MFIGYYIDYDTKKEHFNIYYKNSAGYDLWHKDTFFVDSYTILDFKISGKTYKEKQSSLRDLAIDWQNNFSSLSWSYGEYAEVENYFYENGKRYGLLKEFKENCIC